MVATTSYATKAKTAKSVGFGRDFGTESISNSLSMHEIY